MQNERIGELTFTSTFDSGNLAAAVAIPAANGRRASLLPTTALRRPSDGGSQRQHSSNVLSHDWLPAVLRDMPHVHVHYLIWMGITSGNNSVSDGDNGSRSAANPTEAHHRSWFHFSAEYGVKDSEEDGEGMVVPRGGGLAPPTDDLTVRFVLMNIGSGTRMFDEAVGGYNAPVVLRSPSGSSSSVMLEGMKRRSGSSGADDSSEPTTDWERTRNCRSVSVASSHSASATTTPPTAGEPSPPWFHHSKRFGGAKRWVVFEHTFRKGGERCFFASSFPYSYKHLTDSLSRWETMVAQGGGGVFLRREGLCYTAQHRLVELITISASSSEQQATDIKTVTGTQQRVSHVRTSEAEDPLAALLVEPPIAAGIPVRFAASVGWSRPPVFPGRQVILFTARVHPGETPASHVLHGFIEFLLSGDPRARQLLQRFVFKIVPMLNPDGVALGRQRTDAADVDLNRCYEQPDPNLHPSIYATQCLMGSLARYGRGNDNSDAALGRGGGGHGVATKEVPVERRDIIPLMERGRVKSGGHDDGGESRTRDAVAGRVSVAAVNDRDPLSAARCDGAERRLASVASDFPSPMYLYMDFHAHSTMRGAFVFANAVADAEDRVDNALLPKLIAMHCPNGFDFNSCDFTSASMSTRSYLDGRTKRGTARVALANLVGLLRSYTFEVAVSGPVSGSSLSSSSGGSRCTVANGESFGRRGSRASSCLALPTLASRSTSSSTRSNNIVNPTAGRIAHGMLFTRTSYCELGRAIACALLDASSASERAVVASSPIRSPVFPSVALASPRQPALHRTEIIAAAAVDTQQRPGNTGFGAQSRVTAVQPCSKVLQANGFSSVDAVRSALAAHPLVALNH